MITKKQSALLLLLTFAAVYPHETENTQQTNIPLWERIKNNPVKSNFGPFCTLSGLALTIWATNKHQDARIRGMHRHLPESSIQLIQSEHRRNQFIGLTVGAIGLFLIYQVYADKNDPQLSIKENEKK